MEKLNDNMRVHFRRVTKDFIWDNKKITYDNSTEDRMNRYLNGQCSPNLTDGTECNFSHMQPGLDTIEEFATLIYWMYNGHVSIIEAPDEFLKFYHENSEAYVQFVEEV